MPEPTIPQLPPGRHGGPIGPPPSGQHDTVGQRDLGPRPPSSFDLDRPGRHGGSQSHIDLEVDSAPHIPSTLKRKVGGVAMTVLALGGAFTAFRAASQSDAPVAQTEPKTEVVPEAPKTGIELLYQESKVKEQSSPFETITEPGREHLSELEQKAIDKDLETHQAEFVTAVELTSGIKMNIYTSKLDDKAEPFSLDARALDVMVTELISQAGQVENSPISGQITDIQARAAKGKLDAKFDIMFVSNEKLCLAVTESETGDVARGEQVLTEYEKVVDIETHCKGGVNKRLGVEGKPAPALNQFIMAIDMGDGKVRSYYDQDVLYDNKIITPDQMASVTLSHELAHALFGLTDRNGITTTKDVEHEQFVYHVESNMYKYFADLNEQPGAKPELVTPVHVDDAPVVKPPHHEQGTLTINGKPVEGK